MQAPTIHFQRHPGTQRYQVYYYTLWMLEINHQLAHKTQNNQEQGIRIKLFNRLVAADKTTSFS